MERRLIIALALGAAVLFGYPYLLNKFYPQPQPTQKTAQTSKPADDTKPAQAHGKTEQTASAPAKEGAKPAAAPAKKAAASLPEETATIDTPLYKAVLTSAGGGVSSWEVKKYNQLATTPLFSLRVPVLGYEITRYKHADTDKLVNLAATIAADRSFKTEIEAAGGASEPVNFKFSSSSITLAKGENAELVMRGSSGHLVVEKRYAFDSAGYVVKTGVTFENTGKTRFEGKAHARLSSALSGTDETGYHLGPIYQTKDKNVREEAVAAGAPKPVAGKLRWLGLEDKYFLAALITAPNGESAWTVQAVENGTSAASIETKLSLAPGEKTSQEYSAYVGPKEYNVLRSFDNEMEEAIEFGYFAFMARPTLAVLNFMQRYLLNYGIAIILLTVIIKVAFYPLTKASLKSMKEMQAIQPQLAAIKQKYKDDKKKQNEELMELYKRYKINPLSGCLPMVMQIPVFIALYEVLYVAIELKHAPFVWWITDLSVADPYLITPLLMGASMFIQQKMTPMPDPTQAKIMLLMPVFFTFMFLDFPAGLVIYWLVNNILSIAQQYYVQKGAHKA